MSSIGNPEHVVTLADYFSGREGLQILRPESRYLRRPAVLVNPSATTPQVRRRYRRNPVGRTPAEGVARVLDVTIFGPGVMQLQDGRILAESLYRLQRDPWANAEPGPVEHTFETAVHIGARGNDNYGHFLVEQLPRLVLNQAAYPADATILLGERSRGFAPPMLEYAGVDTARVRWIGGPVRVRTLYWPTRTTWHRLVNSPHVFDFLRGLGRKSGLRALPERLLFVGRRDARTRRLVNDAEAFAKLEPYGFERVDPGHLPFQDQVRTFSSARVVVAVAGAALTNMVFMPPGGTVVMIGPSTSAGYFFWDLSHHLDLQLAVLWGANANPTARSKNTDFSIDVDLLGRLAEAAALRKPLADG